MYAFNKNDNILCIIITKKPEGTCPPLTSPNRRLYIEIFIYIIFSNIPYTHIIHYIFQYFSIFPLYRNFEIMRFPKYFI